MRRRAWRKFRTNRLAAASVAALFIVFFFSATAEIWANRKPILLRYDGSIYAPVFRYYAPAQFGQNDVAEADYTKLKLKDGDWAIWPPLRWDPLTRNENLTVLPGAPSSENWLGTDEAGRDVAARILYGFRYSMAYALAVWALVSGVGALLGLMMGYRGGWTDLVGQRAMEIVESLPYLMILITLVSIFRPSLLLLATITVFFNWVTTSIYFRAEFLKLRRRDFVEAARAIGASEGRIIFRHLLPNSLTPWLTYTPFMIAANVTSLAVLDFLGFGLPPPTPSWGELLSEALNYFQIAWWLAVYPSAALFLTLVALNVVGEGVREALDPRG